MKSSTAGAVLLLAALLNTGCASTRETAPDGEFTLDEILSRMPAQDSLEARWLASSLLQLGPDAVSELCSRLDTAGSARRAQPEFAFQTLALAVTRPGRERERMQYVTALAGVLTRPQTDRQKVFVLEQLQRTGKRESIPVASRFLQNPRLCDPAARALVAMGQGADEALLSALPGSSVNCRRIIIQNLGVLRSREAVGPLLKEAASDNPEIRRAARSALANIGDSRAGEVLARWVAESSPGEREENRAAWLLYAGRRIEGGNTAEAAEIAASLLSAAPPGANDPVRPAALELLVRANGEAAVDELVRTMADTGKQVRQAALELAQKTGRERSTAQWVEVSRSVRPEVRAEIVTMLGRRGDPSAAPEILQALQDPDSRVREAATDACVRLLDSAAVSPLLELLERNQGSGDIDAVRAALKCLPAKIVIPPALESLPRMPPEASVMLLDVLGEFGTATPAAAISAISRSGSGAVRIAAVKALGVVGGEKDQDVLIDVLLNSGPDDLRMSAQRSLVVLCSRQADPETRTARLCEAYGRATGERRLHLLPVIGRLGGSRALALVSSERRAGNPDTREAAVRALAEWRTIAAYDTLLSVAESSEKLPLRVIAIRGAVRVVQNASVSPTEAVRYHERTLAAAERVEEKRLVLGALASIRTPYALKAVTPYIGSDSLGLDAALAAARISGEGSSSAGMSSADVARVFIDATVPSRYRRLVDRKLDATPGMNDPPAGFRQLFNGRNLDGWKGLVENPLVRAAMTAEQLAQAQAKADSLMKAHWSVTDGVLLFDGKGESICSAEDFEDFELLVDWKIDRLGDSGIYLRGSPQVQIWDPAQWPEGSGGLYNNQNHPSKPLRCADHPVGEWNTFRIRMIGERVTVYLNDVLLVDSVVLENYWNRSIPIFPSGQIELQSHNSPLEFRNIFIREIPRRQPLFSGRLFNGVDLSGWTVVGGKEGSWGVKEGILYTTGEGGGWLSTDREYDNFELELDFRLAVGGNSGVFLRSPRQGDPAYTGMEIQVLDDEAEVYAALRPWQYCGSLYGVVAAAKGATKKANEWQHYRIVACGPRVTVTLNGQVIVDEDLIDHMDQESIHPGLKRRSGYIGLQSHTARVEFRNIILKELEWKEGNERD